MLAVNYPLNPPQERREERARDPHGGAGERVITFIKYHRREDETTKKTVKPQTNQSA